MTARPRPRPGFTLIELLIVMGIIVLIAALGFLLIPNLDRNKGVPNAVAQVGGWINLSKQNALRDHAPRGVRLIHDGNGQCNSLQYIGQPDPVAPRGPGVTIDVRTMDVYDRQLFPAPPHIGRRSVVTLFRNPPPGDPNHVLQGQYPPEPLWINWDGVEPGDYFELSGNSNVVATIRRFTWGYPLIPVNPGPTPPANPTLPNKFAQLVLDRVIEGTEDVGLPPYPPIGMRGFHVTSGFRVIRNPRPLIGEPMLQMHKDVFIDLTASYPCPLNLDPVGASPSGINYSADVRRDTSQFNAPWQSWGPVPIPLTQRLPQPIPVDVNYVDILFNAQGFVANAPTGQYILAVRHKERPTDMLFVTIYTRTGKITANMWNDGPGDPYQFVRDGSTPGL